MKINNKYPIGDTVVYPGASLANPGIIESTVTGVSLYVEEGNEIISYKTEHSYGVAQEHLSNTKGGAKRKLLQMMKQKRQEILEGIDNAIAQVEKTKPNDLINKLPNETTDPDAEI